MLTLICAYETLNKSEEINTMATTKQIMKTWTLKNSNLKVEFDGKDYYLLAGEGKGTLVNRLDAFVTSYQLSVLREIGQPESHAR